MLNKRKPSRVQQRPVAAPPPVVEEAVAALPEVQIVPPGTPRVRAKTKDPMDPTFQAVGLRNNNSSPIVHRLTDQILI